MTENTNLFFIGSMLATLIGCSAGAVRGPEAEVGLAAPKERITDSVIAADQATLNALQIAARIVGGVGLADGRLRLLQGAGLARPVSQ